MIKNNDLKDIIRKSLNLEDNNNTLNESYVVQPKVFNIRTDYLSDKNIKNHLELYDQYVKDFNKISASLDSANRENVSSSTSPYRSLKN